MTFRMGIRCLAAGGLVFVTAAAGFGQVLPKNRPATPPAGAPAVVPGETAGQARREGREEARDARAADRAAGAPLPQGREAARDTRQATRQNIRAGRAADYGVWFGPRGTQGLTVDYLANNGVLATAGLKAGDQLVSINGQPVTSEAQFVQMLGTPATGGQPYQMVVLRGGQRQTLTVQPNALTQGIVNWDPFYQYGMVMDDRTPNAYTVQRVYPRTPAYYAGLRAGDVINTVGGQRIASMDAFSQSLAQANGALNLGVTRNGQPAQLQLDSPSIFADTSAHTTLRPNIDADPTAPAVTTPAVPATPATPAIPGAPATPAAPAVPARPAIPATPAPPAAPAAPAVPAPAAPVP